VNEIIEVMMVLMRNTRYQDLYGDLQALLPKLFNYGSCGILFFDDNASTLYSITCSDYKNTMIKDEHLMRFPLSMGMTGIAIE
jgi:hypothetical protein